MKSDSAGRHAARSGFEAFDPAQSAGLSDAQRDAVARAIVAQGPTLILRASTQRLLSKVAVGGALAAAAAFAFMLQSKQAEPDQTLPAVAAAAPSCAADGDVTPITSEGEGGSRLQIGSRIAAVTGQATQLSIVEAAPCVTRLALTEGTLTLQAQDLGGGTLWVDTPHGQVRAAGAFLRIVTLASSTTLRVVEGAVVMRSLDGAESIGAGSAFTIGREGMQRFALSADERTTLLGTFDEPVKAVQEPAPDAGPKPTLAPRPARTARPRAATASKKIEAQPAVSAAALLAEADALWRKGNHDAARQAFRAAAQDKGPMGEAAWLRLARLELSAGSTERALMALNARKSRTGASTLGAEALWLEAHALERAGRGVDAARAAERLIRDYPGAPQVPSARRLLTKSKVP